MTTHGRSEIERVLRRRGYVPVLKENSRHLLLPLDATTPPTPADADRFRKLFGKDTFRKVLRRLTTAGHGKPLPMASLEEVAGKHAQVYADFLVALSVAVITDEEVALVRAVDNIGPTLEWYVADLCERELDGSAAWSVQLEGLGKGGDYDVLAWLAPTLLYVELKSSHQEQVSDDELKQFLNRSEQLMPDLTILLLDTQKDLAPLLRRLEAAMRPVLLASAGPVDPSTPMDLPYVRPLQGELKIAYGNIAYGYHHTYVVNAKPSILTQLCRCLRHYHAHVKGRMVLRGGTLDFVAGTWTSSRAR